MILLVFLLAMSVSAEFGDGDAERKNCIGCIAKGFTWCGNFKSPFRATKCALDVKDVECRHTPSRNVNDCLDPVINRPIYGPTPKSLGSGECDKTIKLEYGADA